MSKKFTLLIDMDGVICDWAGAVSRIYYDRYPDRPYLKPEEITQFYVEELYPEEHRDDVMAISREEFFYAELRPLPGALSALKHMQETCQDFIEPFICSSPETEYEDLLCHSEKAQWIEERLGSWWTKRLILTKDKTLVMDHVLIDDKPSITGVTTPVWKHMIFDQPYNQGVETNGGRFDWSMWPLLKQSIRRAIPANTNDNREPASRIILVS